jgi:hypothetical protein
VETNQIICCLTDVKSFQAVFPSDLLPRSIDRTGTVIINAYPHTEKGSHRLAVHLQTRSYTAYCFDSYGLPPFILSVYYFLTHNFSLWNRNNVQLHERTSKVCGQYCCLFALYMDRVYTPKQFVDLIDTAKADSQISIMFEQEFWKLRRVPSRKEQWCCSFY